MILLALSRIADLSQTVSLWRTASVNIFVTIELYPTGDQCPRWVEGLGITKMVTTRWSLAEYSVAIAVTKDGQTNFHNK